MCGDGSKAVKYGGSVLALVLGMKEYLILTAAIVLVPLAQAQSYPEKSPYLIDSICNFSKHEVADIVKPMVKPRDPADPPPPVSCTFPPMVTETISADAMFVFGKTELTEVGKARLTEIATILYKFHSDDQILITAHTDRLGSLAYNQILSEQRAQFVAYFLNIRGVSASRMKTEGKGKSSPSESTRACKGTQPTKVLIACLQPDRRVNVTTTIHREQ